MPTVTVVVERWVQVRCPYCGKMGTEAAEGGIVRIKCKEHGMSIIQIYEGVGRQVKVESCGYGGRDFTERPIVAIEGLTIDG